MLEPTKRFSSRVANYVKYRPGYPAAVLDILRRECDLTPDSVVADVGSGTGLLTELFVGNGNQVFAVEPNADMRAAGEQVLAGRSGFVSVDGSAEATTLADRSVDLIVAGQAFHWFDFAKTRVEWERILKPGGWVGLVWNIRDERDPFMQAYDAMLRKHAPEYAKVNHERVDASYLDEFFGAGAYALATCPSEQRFDYAGLEGRLLSSSYAPEAGDPLHQPMIAALHDLFDQYQRDGQVVFPYETRVYYGHLI